jgi:membrane protein implicated in regulation of membrane protease activity
MLGIIIYILLVLAILGTILIGLGVGIGYLLWAILPGIDLGMAIVAGAVFAVGLLDLFRRLVVSMKKQQEDSEAEAALGDEPLVVMPRSLLERTPSGRTKRKRPR